MSQQLSNFFEKAQLATALEEFSGDLLPTPPSSPFPGNQFFINCICSDRYLEIEPEKVLANCRGDTLKVISCLNDNPIENDFKSVCFSIYSIPTPGSNLRVYRTLISGDNLAIVNSNNIGSFIDGEESHLPALSELINVW